MISVVICSKSKELAGKFTAHIAETIGCAYDIQLIDNSGGEFGICKAYNRGAGSAGSDYLVFVHEDVVFHTKNWGQLVINQLSDQSVGLAGCAGSVYKSDYPTAWIDVPPKCYRSSAIAGWKENSRPHKRVVAKKHLNADVAVLDGMLLCMRKEVWNKFQFDEENLTGFHFYDMDISLRVGSGYRNVVMYNISLEHLSAGTFNENWFRTSLEFHGRMRNQLPKSVVLYSKSEERQIKHYALLRFLTHLRKFKIKPELMYRYLPNLFWHNPFSRQNLSYVKTIFFSKNQSE